jgi:hypothetical protein
MAQALAALAAVLVALALILLARHGDPPWGY